MQIIKLSKKNNVLWENIFCFICNKNRVIINKVILWAFLQEKRLVTEGIMLYSQKYFLHYLLYVLLENTGCNNTLWILWNKLHIWRAFESPQEEACWFQLAVCCFTLWVLELVIPRMKRVWGALFCSSHCAISLYDSFVPSKHWLPHSKSPFSLWGVADIPHLLGLSQIPVKQGGKWP